MIWPLAILAFGTLGLCQAFASDPQALLERMDGALVPERYHAVVEMTTVKPTRTTSMVFDLLYRKGTGTLMELLSPARVKGTKLLQKDSGLWLYSPASGTTKPLRLSPQQSFQGSVFSNGDVSEPQFSRDYQATEVGHERVEVTGLGTLETVVLEGTARTSQAQYGKVRCWVQPGTDLPIRIEYTAKSGLLFKRMEFSDFKLLAGTLRPTTYAMESFEEPGTSTVLKYRQLEARPELAESLFSDARLTR